MIKKSIMLVLLVLVLALSFAACNRDDNDQPTQQQETQQPAADPPPVVDPDPVDDNGEENGEEAGEVAVAHASPGDFFDADLDGFLDQYFPATDLGGITLRWVGFGSPDHYNETYATRWTAAKERVEQRFNVNLEFIENDDIVAIAGAWGDVPDVMIASIVAGDPIANLWRGNAGYWFPLLANNGHLRSMDSYLRANVPEGFFAFLGESATGTAYGFNWSPAYSWNIFTYNRDMIRGVGMEMTPSEMFVAGRWSLEDFYEYVVELNSLLPSDVTPVGMHENWWKRLAIYANGGYILNPRTSVPGLLHEESLEPLRMLQRLVQEGLYLQPGWHGADEDPAPHVPEGMWSWAPRFIGGSHMELFRNGNVAISSMAPWDFQTTSTYFEFGIVPPPWGSNVTFPGDWRDLKTHTPYTSVFNDASTNMIIQGTPDVVTSEVFFNMVFTWYAHNRGHLVRLVEMRDYEGDGILRLGSSQYLFTQLDEELWEWYASNPTWEGMDSGGYWLPSQNDAWRNTLGSGGDFRAAFEAAMPQLIWNLYDFGRIQRENIPAEMWTLAEEFGAGIE